MRLCYSALLILATALPVRASDWAQFRGPSGSARSESTLPISWTPEANISWKAELPGPGVSSPIVVSDRVFVTCYSGYGLQRNEPGYIENLMRHLVCFDATNGEKLWQKDIPASQPEDPYTGIGVTAHGYASHTPVSDGEHVFAFFGKSGVFAFDLEGKELWNAPVGKESDPMRWGSSSSPITYKDLVIVTASAESQSIIAFDKATGKEVWRQEAAMLDNMWGTPLVANITNGRDDLILSVPGEIWGMDPETGKLRWHCKSTGATQSHSSPILGGDMVFAFTGRGGGSVAVKTGGAGDMSEESVIWSGKDTARFGSPVGYKSRVYLVANGIIKAIDGRSGKELDKARLRGGSSGGGGFGSLDYPSPVVAADKLYHMNGKGQMFVFDLADGLEQVSLNVVSSDESESFGGSPAISNDRMYIRSSKAIYCIADTGVEVAANASKEFMAKTDDAAGAVAGGFGGGRGGRQGGGTGGRGGFGGGGGRSGFNPNAIFDGRDQNKDGKLTREELSGSMMADRMDEMDKDGDKAISKEEFTAGIGSMFGSGGRGGRGGSGRSGGRGNYGGFGQGEDTRPKRPARPVSAQ